jgi:hypothetical protein
VVEDERASLLSFQCALSIDPAVISFSFVPQHPFNLRCSLPPVNHFSSILMKPSTIDTQDWVRLMAIKDDGPRFFSNFLYDAACHQKPYKLLPSYY